MSVFSFLRDVVSADTESDQKKRLKKGQFRFYADQQRAQGNKTPGTNPVSQARNLAVGSAREIAKVNVNVPLSIAENAVNSVQKVRGKKPVELKAQATDPISKLVFGDAPIETYETRRKGYEKALKSGESILPDSDKTKQWAGPLSFIGMAGILASDATPGGGAKGGLGKQLIKASTKEEVKKLIPSVGDDVAQAIATTKDPNIIKNILSKQDPNASQLESLKQEAKTPQGIDVYHGTNADFDKFDLSKARTSGYSQLGIWFSDSKKAAETYGKNIKQAKIPEKDYAHYNSWAEMEQAISNEANRRLDIPLGQEYKALVEGLKADGYKGIKIGPTKIDGSKQTVYGVFDTKDIAQPPKSPPKSAPEILDVTPPNQRAFVKTVQDSPTSTPELSNAISKLEQQYTPTQNPELLSEVRKIVDKDPNKALSELLLVEKLSDKDTATGLELMSRAQKEGRVDEAVKIADFLDNQLRESGRAIQAASIWGRLSPEGILRLAARKTRQAREGRSGVEKEAQIAKEIQDTVEGAVPPIDQPSVSGVIKDITEESTGQKLAKGVEKAASPAVRKKADELVKELLKKVKQEYLLPRTIAKKPPLQTLKEVFGRLDEAEEAYPLAQAILREKYADVPHMLEALDKFFGSKLNLPAANSTINRAIQEQLKANGEKISQIIYKSLSTQEQTVDNVATALVKEGFDQRSAKVLAEEVAKRLNQQVIKAKQAAIDRLATEAKPRAQKTYLDKLSKLSNIGVLDKEDYLHLARAKLDLPQLTVENSQKIHLLAQKMQDLPDGIEKRRIIEDIGELINESIPKTKGQIANDIFGAPKSLLSTGDLSGLGRQGGVLGSRFPAEFKKAFANQVKYLSSTDKYKDSMAEIASRPNISKYEEMGLDLTGISGYKKPEEAFVSSLPEQIPLAGRAISASNRAYTGALTELRAGVADRILKELEDAGIDWATMPKSHKESLGRFINTASGRGGKKGGWIDRHAQGLGQALFSPRLWKSRLDMLNPYYYYQLKGPARKYALQSAGSFASIASTILGLAIIAGAEVETDARSSDFLKIKVGDTRYDILGGFQQNLVLIHRELVGEKKNSLTGQVTKFGEGYGAADRLSILQDFIQNKENPVVALGTRALSGKDRAGQPLNPVKEGFGLITPLALADTINQTGRYGLTGLPRSLPGYFGAGSQTYGKRDMPISDKQEGQLKLLEQKGVPKKDIESYKAFFQQLKVGPDRDATSNEINKTLATGDTAKAKEIAKKYNEQVMENIRPWLEENRGKTIPKPVLEYLNSSLINLTNASIKTRIQGIAENPDKYKLKFRSQ